MIAPAVNILAPAIADLGSWFGDIAARLWRGEITAAQALSEMDKYTKECDAEIKRAISAMAASRTEMDKLWDSLPPAVRPPTPGGPT